jgi:hypothetical protein
MTEFFNPDLYDDAPGNVVRPTKDRADTALLYPPQGYSLANPIEAFTVNAGEISQVQIELGVSAKTVMQPVAVKDITDPMLVPDQSVYFVSNSLGLPMDPKEWRNYGGKIKVKINPDTVSATVRIYGPSIPEFSPFTIGKMSDGGITYGALYLVGTGVAVWRRTIRIDTGLTLDEVADDTSAAIDNPFTQSREQAYDAAHSALCRKLGSFQRVTLTLAGVAGIDGVDPGRPETALGRVVGARVAFDGSFYRIRTASITPAGIEVTCEQDTRFSDFDRAFPNGIAFDDFDALHQGQRFRDFDADPLAGGRSIG